MYIYVLIFETLYKMKKIYLLFLLATIFSFNQIYAVPCPESAIITNSGANLFISYPTGTAPSCGDPASVIVDGTTTFDTPTCFGDFVVYNYLSGPVLGDRGTMTLTGFDTSCSYTDSVLPVEDFHFLNATFKVFPNPLRQENILNVKLSTNITANLYMYDLLGKLVFSNKMNNVSRTAINTSALVNGLYLLKMVTDNATVTRKVVIIH